MKRSLGISAPIATMALAGMLFLATGSCSAKEASAVPQVPVKGMVTMVDLGATGCIPCKIMIDIVDSLQPEYKGKAAIFFIDVRNHPYEGQKFGIKLIPTQIFYDKDGKEVYRHQGVMSKEAVIAKLESLGVR
ncbi:MAG: thioredoxin family protein [Syntrophobacteraceae bacterium]|nr:thioredoxin family protein [Syntrophobacteraceae bacterium]